MVNLCKFALVKPGEALTERVPMVGSKSPVFLLLRITRSSDSKELKVEEKEGEEGKVSSSTEGRQGSQITLSASGSSVDGKKKKGSSSLLKRTTSKLMGRTTSRRIEPSELSRTSSSTDLSASELDTSSSPDKPQNALDDADLVALVADMVQLLGTPEGRAGLTGLLSHSSCPHTELYLSIYRAGKAVSLDSPDLAAAAFVLKYSLSNRKEPLVPAKTYQRLLEHSGSQSKTRKDLSRLPGETQMTFHLLLHFLSAASSGSSSIAHDLCSQETLRLVRELVLREVRRSLRQIRQEAFQHPFHSVT